MLYQYLGFASYEMNPPKKTQPFARISQLWAIEFVHKDFLGSYIRDHALPYAHTFAEKSCRHDRVLADMRAFAKGCGKNSHSGIEERLRPAKR